MTVKEKPMYTYFALCVYIIEKPKKRFPTFKIADSQYTCVIHRYRNNGTLTLHTIKAH